MTVANSADADQRAPIMFPLRDSRQNGEILYTVRTNCPMNRLPYVT